MRSVLMFLVLLMFSFVAFAAEAAAPVAKLGVMEWVAIIAGCLFAISEVIGAIPSVKSNGVFQIIVSILKAIVGKK